MRAIVTGAAGFIGSHVAEFLISAGWEVLGIDDLSGGLRANVPEGVRFEQRDCGEELDGLFLQFRPTAVYHLAAYAAEGLSHHIPVFNYQNNIVVTANVQSAAFRSGAEHFVFTSSIAAYGHPDGDQPLDEASPCRPCDPYGTAKLACEHHIHSFYGYFGSPSYTIFRPHNVFGPRQNVSDPYRNVVGIFIRCALTGQPMPIFGDGLQTRSFSHIGVVARCIAESAWTPEAKNQTFNVGGDEPMSILELAQSVASQAGTRQNLQHLPPRQEVTHAHATHDRAKRVFADAYRGALSIQEGLRETVAYVQSTPIPEPTECPSQIEIAANLPPLWKNRL
jgi:UDP-glucose 4-epimerase